MRLVKGRCKMNAYARKQLDDDILTRLSKNDVPGPSRDKASRKTLW